MQVFELAWVEAFFAAPLDYPEQKRLTNGRNVGTAWKRRREVPDQQVRDAADQYEEARRLLWDLLPGSGVLLPAINAASIAVELYLKSLASQSIHVPVSDCMDAARVYAKPEVANHHLQAVYDAIDDEIKSELEEQFRLSGMGQASENLKELLGRHHKLYAISRYPFEPGANISSFDINLLMELSSFLHEFVSQWEPVDKIEWR